MPREGFRKEALWGEHKRRRVLLARKARQKPGKAEQFCSRTTLEDGTTGSSSGSCLEDMEVDRSFTEERGFQQSLPSMSLFMGLWPEQGKKVLTVSFYFVLNKR